MRDALKRDLVSIKITRVQYLNIHVHNIMLKGMHISMSLHRI